jgi:hypothetical protein
VTRSHSDLCELLQNTTAWARRGSSRSVCVCVGGGSITCAKGGKAVEVTKLMPSSAAAANTFCEDETGRRLLCACFIASCAVGQLQLTKKIAKRRSATRTRADVRSKSTGYYALSSEDRQVVGLRCRADDLPGTSYV